METLLLRWEDNQHVRNGEQKGLTLLVPTEVRGYANLSFSAEEASAKYANFFIEEIWVSLWAIFLTAICSGRTARDH